MVLADLTFSSCQSYLTYKYNLSRRFDFKNRIEFAAFVEKQTGLKQNDIFYSDSTGYTQLLKKLQQKNMEGILWGLYTENPSFIHQKKEKQDKLYCKKRMENIVTNFIGQNITTQLLLIGSSELFGLRLLNIMDNQAFMHSSQEKKLVILCYATGFGTYYRDLFHSIRDIVQLHGPDTKVIVLCLDPVFKLIK